MANDIIETEYTIEISSIDSDYMMPESKKVQSVVFIPGAAADVVEIIENNDYGNNPSKVKLISGDGEPRGWPMDAQNIRLGFVFLNGTFTAGAKVIFNIGERGY